MDGRSLMRQVLDELTSMRLSDPMDEARVLAKAEELRAILDDDETREPKRFRSRLRAADEA